MPVIVSKIYQGEVVEFEYKLVMFGFPALCEDLSEVQSRIRQIPIERAQVETLEQCYLIELKTGKNFAIKCDEKGYFIEECEGY